MNTTSDEATQVNTSKVRVTTASISKRLLDKLIAQHVASVAGITLSSEVEIEIVQSRAISSQYTVKLTERISP